MKILILSPSGLPIPAVKGGAVASLIESLIKENESHEGIKFCVISPYDEYAKMKSARFVNTQFIYLKENKIFKLFDFALNRIAGLLNKNNRNTEKNFFWKQNYRNRIKGIIKSNEFDRVVFENTFFLLKILKNKKISKKFKNNIFFHLHNDIPNNVDKDELKKCKILMISEYLKNKIKNDCGEKFIDNCFVLKNGINISNFTQKFDSNLSLSLKKRLGISIDKKIILFVGRIVEYKGIRKVIDAYKLLKRNDVVLLVVGSCSFGNKNQSPFEKDIEKTFSQLGDGVKFVGFVPYEEVYQFYTISDVAVLPSTWNEPAGLTMIEALCCGTPLITTRVGGIPEYIKDDYATIIDNDDKLVPNIVLSINRIFNDYQFYKKQACKAKEHIALDYSTEKYYINYIKYVKKGGGL